MRSSQESFLKYVRYLLVTIMLALCGTIPAFAQAFNPVEVGNQGYINGTPLTTHTTAAFNTTGASTLVVFVSTNSPWNGLPVSISGVSDNMGNSWNVLTGPTVWTGSQWVLLSAIYYVNIPATSNAHTVSVQLTNPAPLVMDVFAIAGSDITSPPIYSAITDPGSGKTSPTVTTAPITVPANTLLLGWAKNETNGNATATNGYTLDPGSTSYLWAESRTAPAAGSYTGNFQYDNSIGWQTAVVGLKPSTAPAAFSQTVTASYGTPLSVTLTAVSPGGFPLTYSVVTGPTHGTLSGIAPNLTYTPNSGYSGSDAFTFKANDGTADSNVATISITVHGPNHPPVASNTSVSAAAGTATAVMLTASDPDGDPLTYSIVAQPLHGNLSSGVSANRTYTPNPGYLGSDVFTFKANDGIADSNVATVSITVVPAAQLPAEVGSQGYINGTPLTSHTTATFNSVGASTLVVFVSTNSPWSGQPVSISGVSDNLGNSWGVLTGPTLWNGNQYGLLSGIYYVNVPATSTTHTVTVRLTNPAPLVMDVFALSGSDITGPPIYSAITDPGVGATSASVMTAPITVPVNSLLLSWAKNETGGTATAIDGYRLDPGSTSYLWAETETAPVAGSYTGDFQYDSSIGWQTAVVGLKPATGPTAYNQAVTTNHDTPLNITLTAQSPSGLPLTYSVVSGPTHGSLSGTGPNLIYTPSSGYIGSDKFTFKANDGSTDSNIATVTITVASGIQLPAEVGSQGYINSNPLTVHSTAAFNTVGATTLVAFVGSHSPWNGLPVSISQVTDNMGNSWTLLDGPTQWIGNTFPMLAAIYYVNVPATSNAHTVTVHLTNAAPLVVDIFAVSGSDITGPPIYSAITDPGVGLTSASVMTAPITVPAGTLLLSWAKNETGANATAIEGYTLDPGSTGYLWAESETASSAGSYTGDFQFDSSVGWQTAVVGLKPAAGPAAFNQTVTVSSGTPLSVTLTGASPSGLPLTYSIVSGPLHGALSGTPPNVTYTSNSGYAGSDIFTFKVNDGTTDSNTASVNITVTAAPTISSVSPNSGATSGGTAVTITGANFAAGATVTFGTTAATNVAVVNSTTITATTPAGSTGAVTVTVTNPGGQSGSLATGYTYVASPTVSSVSPRNGPTTGGTAVTITGTNFVAGATVTFGTTAATNVAVVNSTTITATAPAGSAGAVTITVTSSSGQGGSLAAGYTYVANPTVSSVSPNNGPTTGGTAVTITGTNFVAGATVTFGAAAATNIVVVNNTTITATTPVGSAGAVTVTVTNSSGQSGNLASAYTYVIKPTVSSVSPNNGPTTGGTAVTITGTNFAAGATVTFGTTAATNVVVVNSTTITATTPAGSVGAVTVTVTNSGGQSGSLATAYTYVAKPTVTSVSPNSGPTTGATAVTITGTNFATGATVTFGTTAATNVVVVNSTTITATTPAGSAGAVTVTVTNSSGQSGSLATAYTYVVKPTVSSVSPNNGPTTGATAVTITGTNFAAGATVTFGAAAATNVVVVNSTTITATTPAGSAGAVTVTVTANGQSGILASAFTYIGQPTVSSVSPNSGSTTGGTAVTITGTNFAAGATVTFGSAAATNVVVVNSTTITATTPAGSAGAVTVTVTNVGGQSGSLATAYTYKVVATISFAQVAAAVPQTPTATVSVSYPGAQTLGDLNIVVVGWNDTTATVQSVKDSAGNTYSLAIGPTSATGLRQSIYYAANVAGGSNTVTVTFSQAAVYPDIRILEYKGLTTLDVTAGAVGNSASASSGAATTTSANELIFGASTIATTTKAVGSGFTSRIITSPDSDIAEDKIVTAVGSNTATSTLNSAGPWVMQMATFK